MNKATKRFFSLPVALASAAMVALSGLAALYVAYRVLFEQVISIRGVVMALILFVAGVGVFISGAFPKGCAHCARPFSHTSATFVAGYYDQILAVLRGGVAEEVWGLRAVPPAAGFHRVHVELRYCESCQQVGQAHVSEEAYAKRYWKAKRCSDDIATNGPALAAALAMCGERRQPVAGNAVEGSKAM